MKNCDKSCKTNPLLRGNCLWKMFGKADESVRFYTGVPSLSCLQMLSELLRPEAEKLKYWDRNKGKTMAYQTSSKKKPGPKRVLKLEEEFVMTLVRLRLGLMGRHLADIFCLSITSQSYSHYLGVFSICYFQRNITPLAK